MASATGAGATDGEAAVPTIRMARPDDMHLHLRDGDSLKTLGQSWPGIFGRAIIMPNLKPPVTTTDAALEYRQRILDALPEGSDFDPMMTLYLTDDTPPEEITKAHATGLVKAVKLYPAGATTNSASGVTDIEKVLPTLRRMAELGMPLCVHGEVVDPTVDVFEREPVFLERHLRHIVTSVPELKVVLEHITTKEAAAFVMEQGPNVAATITPQHLLFNRNALFQGGLRPHMYCLPVLKHETDRQALVEAIRSGSPKFFLGTDSAPHEKCRKESACGCAGIFSAISALELYAVAFHRAGCLDKLPAFASEHGRAFYGLEASTKEVELEAKERTVPAELDFGGSVVVPLWAGESLPWTARLVE